MALRPGVGLAAVLILAMAARLAVTAPRLGEPVDDPDNYLPLARMLAEGRGFALPDGRPTAYRPPLYPILLAPLVGLAGEGPGLMAGVTALHVLLGVGTVWLTHRAARGFGLGAWEALAASAVVALDPVLVVQARSVMTETLAAFLLAMALAALGVPGLRGMMLGGLAFGLAGLCRPSLLPAAALSAAAVLAVGPGRFWRRMLMAGTLLAVTVGTLAPWAIRNARVLGEPVWTTTHGGYTLALANNPVYYRDVLDGPSGAVWSGADQFRWFDGVNRRHAGLAEPEADRRMRDEALALARSRPVDFARASLARLGRFWAIAPAESVYPGALRLATAAWTVPLWIALALGLARRSSWGWPRVSALAAVLGLTLVHAVFWTDLRMRAPVVPALGLIAASAGGWASAKKSKNRPIDAAEPRSSC